MPTELVPNDLPSEVADQQKGVSGSEVDRINRRCLVRQTSLQRELADAIVRLDPIEEIKLILDCGADVDKPVTQGLTPLHYAVWQKYPEAARLLIEKGCDLNARDDIGFSPLHLAAEHGYTEMLELLLEYNALVNFNFPDPVDDYPVECSDEPLRLALKHSHYEEAKTLLQHGADPNSRYFFGSEINFINPLNSQLLQLLLTYGANPDARDRYGFTPLMKSCRLQQGMESVLLLISYGADVNMRTDRRHDFRSVLHYAVLSGSTAIVNLLIKQGSEINFEAGYDKPTPLDLAILKGDMDMIKLLVESGANVNSVSPIIGSPLHMACSEGVENRLEILMFLFESGADPNLVISSEDGSPMRPALGEYLSTGEELDVRVVHLFLKYGAKVVMQSQKRDPRGILSSISSNVTKNLEVLLALLEASQRYDLGLIRNSSLIRSEQRNVLLKVGQSPLSLKHLIRIYLREVLGSKMPQRIDELNIPAFLKKYLLFEVS